MILFKHNLAQKINVRQIANDLFFTNFIIFFKIYNYVNTKEYEH